MALTSLNAISPIDGRYVNKTRALSPYFSEFALTYYRLMVEIKWLEALAENKDIVEVPPRNDACLMTLAQKLVQIFTTRILCIFYYFGKTILNTIGDAFNTTT